MDEAPPQGRLAVWHLQQAHDVLRLEIDLDHDQGLTPDRQP